MESHGKLPPLPDSRNPAIMFGKDLYAVPGFIDSHVHLESCHLLPHYYEKLVLPHLKLTDKGLFDADIFQHIK